MKMAIASSPAVAQELAAQVLGNWSGKLAGVPGLFQN